MPSSMSAAHAEIGREVLELVAYLSAADAKIGSVRGRGLTTPRGPLARRSVMRTTRCRCGRAQFAATVVTASQHPKSTACLGIAVGRELPDKSRDLAYCHSGKLLLGLQAVNGDFVSALTPTLGSGCVPPAGRTTGRQAAIWDVLVSSVRSAGTNFAGFGVIGPVSRPGTPEGLTDLADLGADQDP